ncbi:cysteine hydrolase family protein [Micromonospora sp. NBC_01796]|uniref:cysteine hydrolase family protein n=1 Tax=Micromonospora sp. NBC_01796 TaxID=2975987 RepID=UPI002DDBEA74|nr:isochorismatase family protein [Micromonospora sp. NBC_01796]WSA83290.1 isochorismatase family protein [Micromonospora sp. NBC_01796]
MDKALLVIDVQESFRQRPIWRASSNPDIVDRVSRLVDTARNDGDLVVWVLHSEPGTGDVFDPANGHVRLIEPLRTEPGDPVLTKTSRNAFTTTNLQQLLTTRGIRELVVCGIQTEQCCETTARVANDLGFDVTFVIDATATFPIQHRNAPAGRSVEEILADPTTLGTADILDRTEYALAGRFATIRTVDEVTGAVPVVPVG